MTTTKRMTAVETPDESESVEDTTRARRVCQTMDPMLFAAIVADNRPSPAEELMQREEAEMLPHQREPECGTVRRATYHLVEMSRCCHTAVHRARANANVSQRLFFATMSLGERVSLDDLADHFGGSRATVNRWIRQYSGYHRGQDMRVWIDRARETVSKYVNQNGNNEAAALILKDGLVRFRSNLIRLSRDGMSRGADPVRRIGRVLIGHANGSRGYRTRRTRVGRSSQDFRVLKKALQGLAPLESKAVTVCLARMLV